MARRRWTIRRAAAWAGCVWAAVVGLASGGVGATSRSAIATVLEQDAPAQTPPVPPEFKRVCSGCHESDRIVQGRRFRSQWEEVIEKMSTEGAVGSDQDFTVIIEYLVREFGRVNVNTASAAEIVQVVRIETAQAEAIVAYRKNHGKFADYDALIAVPGVPVEALSKRRDALSF